MKDKQEDGCISRSIVGKLLAAYGDVFHEWRTKEAEAFFAASGISRRNWSVYMHRQGLADGRGWTLREIAYAEGISHVRVYQIVARTAKNLEKFGRTLL